MSKILARSMIYVRGRQIEPMFKHSGHSRTRDTLDSLYSDITVIRKNKNKKKPKNNNKKIVSRIGVFMAQTCFPRLRGIVIGNNRRREGGGGGFIFSSDDGSHLGHVSNPYRPGKSAARVY